MLEKGHIVKHPSQPQWGLGKILEVIGADKARVHFEDGQVRLLNLTFVSLELVNDATPTSHFKPSAEFLEPLPNPDMNKIRAACELFISRMENKRSKKDDAGVARRVVKEMEKRGRLTLTTFKQLTKWCHTEGAFQEGVDLAHDISRAIYGRVISKDDIQ